MSSARWDLMSLHHETNSHYALENAAKLCANCMCANGWKAVATVLELYGQARTASEKKCAPELLL